jgi:hypothetical protein
VKRRLPLIAAIAAFVIGTIIWIANDPRAPAHAYPSYSTFCTSENGLSLAYKYLRGKGGRRVAILTQAIGGAKLEQNAVVFRVTKAHVSFFDPREFEAEKEQAEPKKPDAKAKPQRNAKKEPAKPQPPKPKPPERILTRDEEAFVREGGRLVLATEEELLDIHEIAHDTVANRVFPIWPDVPVVTVPHAHAFRRILPRMHALYNAGKETVIARERIGAGELFVVAAPDALINADVAKNLPLLMALATPDRPVYFDEVAHGITSGDGALELMKEWGLGPFLLLLIVLCALILWRYARRVGPPEDDHRDTRSDAVDLVHSLGALYGKTMTDGEAVVLYHEALTRSVAAQSGLRGEALHKRVGALTNHIPLPARTEKLQPNELRRLLDVLNEAFSKLRPAERPRGRTGGVHGNHR